MPGLSFLGTLGPGICFGFLRARGRENRKIMVNCVGFLHKIREENRQGDKIFRNCPRGLAKHIRGGYINIVLFYFFLHLSQKPDEKLHQKGTPPYETVEENSGRFFGRCGAWQRVCHACNGGGFHPAAARPGDPVPGGRELLLRASGTGS